MSFQIVITEKRPVTKLVGKDWAVLGDHEVAREPSYVRGTESPTRITELRGYTPEVEKTVTEEREIFKQTVETLDLASVIKAVNGLP